MKDDFREDMALEREIDASFNQGRKLFERIGGRPVLEKVHKFFYDKIYAHPWIGQFFVGIDQTMIERQQSDFFSHLMGGPKIYSGKMPTYAHQHMFITTELFDLRHRLLTEALSEASIPATEKSDWLSIDQAFRKSLIKKSMDDCKKRYTMDEILDFNDPEKLGKAS